MTVLSFQHTSVPLFPHQIDGVEWMVGSENSHYGGLLADDMGLGKSYQCLATMSNNLPAFDADRKTTLIVAALSLVQQWKNEIATKITLPWKVGVYHGNSRKSLNFSDYDVIITTYQCLAKDHPKIPKGCRRSNRYTPYHAKRGNVPDLSDDFGRLLKHAWYRVVLDESQNIKNVASLTAIAARALDATYRWCLSGTPIQNSFEEVYSITSFLFKDVDYSHTDVSDLLRKVTLRRLKEDVLQNLPTKTIKQVLMTLTEEEKHIYDNFEEKAQREISDIISKGNLREGMASILTLLLRWRQICDHPNLFLNTSLKYSSKQQRALRLVRKIIENKPGEKVVIFSHFVEMIAMYKAPLDQLGWDYVTFTGSMNSKQREAALSTFKEDPTVRIMLMSTKAGNVGLNLINANHVILTEPWWNPFVDDQAIDRVHRIGQEKPVRIFKLVIKNTIEERILDIQLSKRNMFAGVFGGEVTKDGNVGLSLSDIMYLANM